MGAAGREAPKPPGMAAERAHRARAGFGAIVAAACLWGSFGLFVRVFQAHGLDALTMTFWRATAGMAVTLAFLLASGRIRQLKVPGSVLARLVPYGLISTALFPFAYFAAISQLPIAVAGILLYTSPIYIVLLSVPMFGERLTGRKLIAVALALGGAALVAGIGSGGVFGGVAPSLGWIGVGAGLLAGFSYALLSVGGKWLGTMAPPDTVMFYSYLTGAIGLGVAVPSAWQGVASVPPVLWAAIAAMGLGPTFLAYRLFLRGMERLEASVAGIVATIEPIVATLLGWLVLGERLGALQVAGGLLILGAVIVLQLPARAARAG